ncbi:hypothetical protein JW916_01370 [Candidatus Sumerlaeota bacterium]|nr:hypothetical protein [Candidatus Sumerlaeota bacterium]
MKRTLPHPAAVLFATFLVCGSVARATDFAAPEKIADGAAKYRLSRLAGHVAAFDSSGTLHATYWSGYEETNPSAPSHIYYRAWSPTAGWGAQEAIDDSEVAGQHVGGRHPGLAVTHDDGVWVVWHDHRDCSPGGSYQDNTEIYGDFKPAGGAFSSTDVRFTDTPPGGGTAENGYTPKIALDPNGALVLAWYDFHYDSQISDLFLKTSDTDGTFNLSETMDAMRLTNLNDRGGSLPSTPAFALPDLAIDSAGARHLAWGGGFGVGGLYYAQAARGSVSVGEELLDSAGWDFFDPAHIAVSPSGDVWIAYGKESGSTNTNERVVLLRKRAGQSAFDAPIEISETVSRQYAPDIAVDSDGVVHLVWIDRRAGRQVYYGRYSPTAGRLVEEIPLTPETGSWERPTLAISERGRIAVLFEENTGTLTGDIWFVRDIPPPAAVSMDRWMRYD